MSAFYSLYDARASAAAYLRRIAPELGDRAGQAVTRAAELYARIAEGVLARRCVTEVAPMRFGLGPDGEWTRELRLEQAALLEEARELEERAVAEIERALEALAA